MNSQQIRLEIAGGTIQKSFASAQEELRTGAFASGLYARAADLFGGNRARRVVVENRLGWLDSPAWLAGHTQELSTWASEIRADNPR